MAVAGIFAKKLSEYVDRLALTVVSSTLSSPSKLRRKYGAGAVTRVSAVYVELGMFWPLLPDTLNEWVAAPAPTETVAPVYVAEPTAEGFAYVNVMALGIVAIVYDPLYPPVIPVIPATFIVWPTIRPAVETTVKVTVVVPAPETMLILMGTTKGGNWASFSRIEITFW